MFRKSYVQKILCSESPIIIQNVLYSVDPLFRKSYVDFFNSRISNF